MLILGIETSCDDTAAAVVRNGREILSSVVSTQDDVHSPYGGIVPEMASRMHLEKIDTVINKAMAEAAVSTEEVDLIAVTTGPGLVGSLLVGLSYAKGMSFANDIPLVGVDHIKGHLFSLELANGVPIPSVALVASGGHTALFHLRSRDDIRVIGTTLDDAAGEAMDKAAKLLDLGYPGGPIIQSEARHGDPEALPLPRPLTGTDNLDFSFSGLKTALFTYLKRHGYLDRTTGGRDDLPLSIPDIAASFQEAVVDVLTMKCRRAVEVFEVGHLFIAGGVARNDLLRERVTETADEDGFIAHLPPPELCTDNAAMIAACGFHMKDMASTDILDLNAYSTKALGIKGPLKRGSSA